jgi:RimJ/RimL family protein N-acetyltransferase
MRLPKGGIFCAELPTTMSEFKIRDIEFKDSASLLQLRNIEDDYRFYQNSAPVEEGDHQNWIELRVKDYQGITLVLEIDLSVMGIAYIDSLANAEVAIRVNPRIRNQGWAKLLREELEKRVAHFNVSKLAAVIHKDNHNSINFFVDGGYHLIQSGVSEVFLRLEKKLTNGSIELPE